MLQTPRTAVAFITIMLQGLYDALCVCYTSIKSVTQPDALSSIKKIMHHLIRTAVIRK